jgi:hypothetical protein
MDDSFMLAAALVVVVPVIADPSATITASWIAAAVGDAAALRPAVRMLPLDDLYFRAGGAFADRLLSCGQDGACIAQTLEKSGAEYALTVSVNLGLDPAVYGVMFIDVKKGEVIAKHFGDERPSADALRAAIVASVDRMFDARGLLKHARIVAEVEPANASVRVDGAQEEDRGSANVFTVLPGKHAVSASAPDRVRAAEMIEVKPGETKHVKLTLAQAEGDDSWLWIGGGAGVLVAAGAVAALIALRSNGQVVCIVTPSERECDPR